MLINEVEGGAPVMPRLINTELPDGSSVVIFPIALAPGSDMLLTRREVARMLRLSDGFLRDLGAKVMPTVKLGAAVRYRLSDVLTYIERKTVGTSGSARREEPEAGSDANVSRTAREQS
jgi:hypothetical protein